MKRATRGFLSFVTAFLIVFSTFGNAFFVAEASEPTVIEETVSEIETGSGAAAETVIKTEEVSETNKEQSEEGDASEIKKEETKEASVVNKEETKEADEHSLETITVKASVPEGEIEKGTKVSLSSDNKDAVIYYNIGGDAYRLYEEEIKVDEDVTIKAYATLSDDETGEIFEFKYTVAAPEEEIKVEAAKSESSESGSGSKAAKADKLNNGDKVVIVVGDRALTGNSAANNKLSAVEVSVSDGEVTLNDEAMVFTVETLSDSFVAFKNSDGKYLATPSSSTQGLVFADALSSDDNDCGKWLLEDASGSFNVRSNTVLTSNNKYQYLSCKNDAFSVLTNNSNNKKFVLVDFYTVSNAGEVEEPEEPEEPIESGTKIEDVTQLSDDQDFVLVFGGNTALTTVASNDGKKLNGAAVELNDDNRLTYADESVSFARLKAVKAETDGQYYITSQTSDTEVKYLTTGATGNSLTFEADKNEYSLWSFEIEEDGSFLVKSVNAVYKEKPQYVEYYGAFTVYGLAAGGKKDAFTFTAYTYPELVKAPEEEKVGVKVTDLNSLYNGREFVLSYNDEKILTSAATGTKLDTAEAKFNDDKKLIYADSYATLKLEKADVEDQYYIVSGSKFLTCPETGNGLSFTDTKDDFSLWTIEDQNEGAFCIKNAKAAYKGNPQYVEYYNGFTTYSFNESRKNIYTFTAYSFSDEEPEAPVNTVAKLLTRELYNGDKVVVYYPAGSKLMTLEATTNGKLKDVAATPAEDGTLETKGLNAAVLSVSLDESGYYSFKTDDGKYLTGTVEEKEENGKKKTYANLILADEKTDNSLWTQEAAGEAGKYYLKNAFAKNGSYVEALEYYSGFSLYGFKADAAYEFSFYALSEGEKVVNFKYDNDTSLTVAQWAGNAHYDEAEDSEKYINGDLYATNDMLDKNAKFTAVVDGKVSKPWTSAKSSNTGSTNYYMGSTGVATESDYMELAFPSSGYGNMSMSFRMRASNTAAGAFQLQYSTDGENFSNLKKGTYSYKYTAYKTTDKVDENGKAVQEPFEVSGSGDITDGIARTSLAPTYYVTFTFEIPNAAANAENFKIRFVPTGGLSAKGDKAPAKGGVIRLDSVKVTGNPVVDPSVTAYVKADPASGEIGLSQKISLTSGTEGAEIFYSINGGEFVQYNDEEKVGFTELPATISAYATKEGLSKSITVNYQYTQAQVAAVKANPNGGAVFADQFVSFKTATKGATILYRFKTAEEIKEESESETEVKTEDQAAEKSAEESAEESADQEEEEQHDDWKVCSGSIKLENLPCEIQVKAVLEGYKDSPVTTLKYTKKLNDKYNIYFGQVHAHTSISDGAGSLAEALDHASKVDNLDFIVITDHSNSIDNEAASKITENVDKSENDEWTYAHNLVKQYTTEDFTCAYGYEMTWSNGLGHINTYNTPGFQSRTQTEYSTYSTALQNYYAALRTVPDSISQFNHPGTTFGDFSDFAYYSEENDALITMIEVGNGEGTIGSSGYFPSYEYYTRALDKGWHVAPTNNQDNHKGKWGDANTARTVMLADTNDEDAIYDAMRNYRIYATEDNDLSIYYTLEGNIMGSILEKDAVGDHLEIKADFNDPTDAAIGQVQVIVNGGKVIATEALNSGNGTVEFTVPSNYSYYYLKIVQTDGDIAVTAPVWVGDVEACGINSTYTNTVLPVAGESMDVNVDLYNNEESDLVIKNIDIKLSDVDGKKTAVANVTGEEAGIEAVKPNGTATFTTDFVYDQAGKVTYEVTVDAVLNGVEKTYTDKLSVTYTVPAMVTDVLIDGSHYNDYVTGYYGGNMSAFISICAKKNIRAQVVTADITPEMLEHCSLLVLSAPAKKNGAANAGNYSVSHYSDEFIAMVKDYVAAGGSVIVCGLADYSDSTDGQTATEQNKLLEAIGSTIRMGSDEVCDDKSNGGQVYRMYPKTYNIDEAAGLFEGLRDGQVYSQYSGCSVDISNATATDFVDAAKWIVKGFETTYSVDCKDASGNAQGGALPNGVKGIKNDNDGNVTFLATQHTKAGGDIYVAGGVFISDFEVKAEMDNNDSLPYTNYTIINNILDGVTVELPTSTIAEARAGEMNEVFAVEGYVTSGTSNPDTTFFDTIYIQDETAGIDIFPYAEAGLEIGTKVRITGFVAQYQGDMELKVISAKILDDEPYVWEPKVVDTKTAMDYASLGGSLLKTTGKVTRVANGAGGSIEEFWLADDTGSEAAIFIDGYIKSGTTGDEGKAALNEFVKVGAEISAAGVLYMHPEGDSDVSVPVFRVRDCDDVVLVKAAPDTGAASGSGSGSGSSGSGSSGSSSGSGSGSSGSSSGSGSSSSGSGSSSGSSSTPAPAQSVLGAIRETVENVIDTIADGIESLINKVTGKDNKNDNTSTNDGTSEGETVGSVTDNSGDQTAVTETPADGTDDQQGITEQTDDGKTATIVDGGTALTDKPESKARKAARAAATTVVVVSGLGLLAIGLRKLLLLLHVIK